MSISVNKYINAVEISSPEASLIITDNQKGTTVAVNRTSDAIMVTNVSGLQGPAGTSINTELLAVLSGSNTFVGNQNFSGSLIPAGPYTENISSYDLGTNTKAWRDLYIGNGSIYFVTGSTSGSISFIDGNFNFGNANALISTIVDGNVSASVNATGDIFLIKSGSFAPFIISKNGSVTISGSADNLFLIKNSINQPILTVSQSGIVVFATQSTSPIGAAAYGGIYFTSSSININHFLVSVSE